METQEFERLRDKFDKESEYFHDDTCSAVFDNKMSLDSTVHFRDENVSMTLNIGDAAYFLDTFLNLNGSVDFFNKFIEYRGIKIVKTDERPETSSFIYVAGKNPKFKVGDVIAVYRFYSDYEGEDVYGTVSKVEFDEEIEDWVYYFSGKKGEYFETEETLIQEQAYVKKPQK